MAKYSLNHTDTSVRLKIMQYIGTVQYISEETPRVCGSRITLLAAFIEVISVRIN